AFRASRASVDVSACWFVVMSAMVALGRGQCRLTARARTLAGPARRRLRRRQFPLTLYRLEARDVAADRAQAQRILQRLGRRAELEAEALLLHLADPRANVRIGHLANLLSSHRCAPPPSQ